MSKFKKRYVNNSNKSNPKKFKKFGGRFNESKNLKTLQSMFKIVQNSNKKNVVYSDRSKASLIEYIKKQDDEYITNKDIEKCDLNHVILSPVHPLLYAELNKEEREILHKESKKFCSKEFKKYGFIAGLELNSDKTVAEGEEKTTEGYHIHLGIDKRFGESIRGSLDLLGFREHMSVYLSNQLPEGIREKLGIKSTQEIKLLGNLKRKRTKRKQDIQRLKSSPDFKKNQSKITELNNGLTNIFKDMDVKNKEREELSDFTKHERAKIKGKQDELHSEIEYINKGIQSRNEDSKLIDSHIQENESKLTSMEQIFNSEMKELQNVFKDKSSSLKHYVNKEHSFYKKIMKDKVKSGEIDNTTFMYQVSQNKTYWKNIEEDERKRQEIEVEEKRREFEDNILYIQSTINDFQKDKDLINLIDEDMKKKLQSKLSDLDYLNKDSMDIFDKFAKRMEILSKEMTDLKIKSKEMRAESSKLSGVNKDMIDKVIGIDSEDNTSLDSIMDDISQNNDIKITDTTANKNDTVNAEEQSMEISTYNKSDNEVFDKVIEFTKEITNLSEEEIIKTIDEEKLVNITKENIQDLFPNVDTETLSTKNTLKDLLEFYEELKEKENEENNDIVEDIEEETTTKLS